MRKLFLLMVSVMMCAIGLHAQTRTIHGTVLDASDNEPLIGATIMPVGSKNGTSADIDGKFTLTLPTSVKKVTVSYVGYTSKTVDVKSDMTIYLDSSTTSLDNLVVVAYGVQTKESLTGSVAVVGAKEIEERPVTDVTAALEGNAPGVQVNNSIGMPGAAPTIRIRGFNSINGSNDPLYVVDGVPYSGTTADLNPADIESISVLKDAASAALYGNKGANGVILITTKKAKKAGKIDVNLQVRQGMYTKGIGNYERMKANEWMQWAYNGYVNGEVSRQNRAINEIRLSANQSFISDYAKVNIYGVPDNELYTNDGLFVGGNPLPGYTDLDWWDIVSVKAGYRQEYNVNAAAATEKFNVFASVGYLKEHGYTKATDFERFNARVNANYNPTSYLRFGLNLAATQQEQGYSANAGDSSTANLFSTMGMAPIWPYYQHDAEGAIMYDSAGRPIWNTAGYTGGTNVGYTIEADKAHGSATVIDGSIYGTAVIPYGFELTVRGTMHRDKTSSYEYTNNVMGSGVAYNGMYMFGTAHYNSHTFLQELTWSHDYGLHHVDALLHHENTTDKEESNGAGAYNQLFGDVYNSSNFIDLMYFTGGISEIHDESYLGRARYNYNQKYFGEVSLRRDGTSRFAKGNRWGTFWSVGGSWVISKENWMQNLLWLDYLKLRAAYGSVGNSMSAGAYSYWSLYAQTLQYSGMPGLVPAQLPSDNVKWEATKTFDIALEGSIFQERLGFSIGYFNKRNTDLLMYVTLPGSAGTNSNTGSNPSVLQNIGDMQNIGWELAFNGDVIRTPEFVWSLSVDATFMKNKILKLPGGRNILSGSYIRAEGASIYEFYLNPWAGVDQLTGQSLYLMDPSSYDFYSYNAAGEYVYDETLFNKYIEDAREADALVEIDGKYYTTRPNYAGRTMCGTALPTVYGSFGTQLSWKGINLSALFTYSLGGHLYDSVYQGYMSPRDQPGAIHVDVANSWTEAPAGMTADSPNRIDPNGIPQYNNYLTQYNDNSSSRWLTKSDYLVFKNLNVSYDLPQKWVRPLQLQNINIGVSIDNLFTVTARKGLNPQYNYSGGQANYFVTPRVYSFQLSARF